jgi:hypothetical protein
MSRAKPPSAPPEEARRIADFLRTLAAQAEADPALALSLREALQQSGLTPTASDGRAARPRKHAGDTDGREGGRRGAGTAAPPDPPDPFVVYREHGEEALRTVLGAQDLATLRGLIRAHRLDPARISARWTSPERVIALIVRQVQARADIGKAFARV